MLRIQLFAIGLCGALGASLPLLGAHPQVEGDPPLLSEVPVLGHSFRSAVQDQDPTERAHGLSIISSESTLSELVAEYSRAANCHVTSELDVRQTLDQTTVGAFDAMAIEPDQLARVIESILMDRGFVLTRISKANPTIYSIRNVYSSRGNSAVRSQAVRVDGSDLAFLEQHPAVMVSTAITMKHADVRQVTNSLRALQTNNNIQVALPVGNTNGMILQGTGRDVLGLIEMLNEVDAEMGRYLAEQEAESPEGGAGQGR